MERSIADLMRDPTWVSRQCGLSWPTVDQLHRVSDARKEVDEYPDICGECGNLVVDCTCPPNVNEDGGAR
jgi:hypothetical protein